MLINQNGQTNVRDVRIKQYSHDADSITVAVDRSRAGHDLSALPLQLLIEASDVMDVVEEGVDDELFKVVNEDSIEITWRPQGRHTTGSERIMCQIVFADCGNVIAYTDTFAVIVEKSLKQVKDCIYADGYTMLDQYLKRLASIRNEAEEIKNATKEAAKQAQESAASAERSAGEASESAKAVAADKQEVEHLLNKVQTEAGDAENAQRGAEVAAGQAREFVGNAAGFASASEVSAQKAETSAAEAAESAQGAATIKQEVIKAGQDVIAEIAEAKETVLAVGRDAVKNIGISKDIAIKEVQDVATEITADREQIGKNKEDITELTAGLADLRKCKAGVIVDEVSGISSLIQDSAEAGFERLTLHGKSTQGSTTGANILKDNYLSLCKGVIDLFSANGLFTVNANYEKNCEFNLYFSAGSIFTDGIKDEATYYIAFRPIGFTPKYNYQLSLKNERDESFSTSSNGIVTSVSGADLKKNVRIQLYFFNVSVSKPVVADSKFQMIFSKNPDCNYEPYTGGAPSPSPSYPQEIESAGQSGEISVKVGRTEMDKNPQVVIIPTPGGLPGIPVSSGGNYTDEKGQQWVADEIDLAKGEKVQWIGKLDLKSSSWAKQSRASNAGGFWFSSRIKSASLFGASVKGTISNIGRLGNPYNMVGDYVWALTNGGSSEFRIGFADSTIDSLEKLTNLLNSLPEAYAMYCLAEPICTPLPPETIAAYKKLHTYSPTTTVINDAGAGMSVGYVADTKLYIDKKIDGVMKALANTQAHLL